MENGLFIPYMTSCSLESSMKLSIKAIVSIALLIVTLIDVTLISILVVTQTSKTLRKQINGYYDVSIIRVEEKINSIFQAWESAFLNKAKNQLLINSLIDELGREQYLPSIIQDLSGTDFGTSVHIGFFDFELQPIKTNSNWFVEMPHLFEKNTMISTVIDNGQVYREFKVQDGNTFYIFGIPVFYQGNAEGMLFAAFRWDTVWEKIISQQPDVSLKLVYQEKTIAESQNVEEAGMKKQIVFPNWPALQLQTLIPEDKIQGPVYLLTSKIMLGSVVLVSIIVLINIFFVAGRITKPIIQLQNAVNKVAKGQWERVALKKGSTEVLTLASAFNQMTEQLEEAQESLKTAKEQAEQQSFLAQKMARFAEAFPFPIMSFTAQGKMEIANLSAESVFGIEILASNLATLFPSLPPDFLEELQQNAEIYYHRVSLRDRYYIFTFQWLSEFEVIHVFGNDVTQLQKAEEDAHEKQLWEALYHRAGEILHEVGNKTLVMVGHLEELRFLQEDLQTSLSAGVSPQSEQYLEALLEETNQSQDTLNVIQEIVDRMSARKRKAIERTSVSMRRLVQDIIEQEKYKTPSVQFHVDCPEELKKVTSLVDPIHIGQIMTNLLKNAEFAIREQEEQQITIDMSTRKDQLVVSVIDNGSGIPQEIRKTIFEDGFTTKGQEGKGIGLALCQNLARENRGDLLLAWSELDQGSNFQLTLPIEEFT